MRKDWLRQWLGSHPFVPFRIKCADGSSYRLNSADYATLAETPNTLLLWDENFNSAIVDTRFVVALEHAEFSDES